MTLLAFVHMLETLLGTSDEINVMTIAVVEGKILAIKAMMASFGIPLEFDKLSHVMREKNKKCAAHSDLFFSH